MTTRDARGNLLTPSRPLLEWQSRRLRTLQIPDSHAWTAITPHRAPVKCRQGLAAQALWRPLYFFASSVAD